MRVALYARVSTLGKGQANENQLLQMREYCQRQGWEIVREYEDMKSGKNDDREQLQKMFADIDSRNCPFETVVAWSLDRFSREGVLGTLKQLERLTLRGIGFISYKEIFLDTCGPFKDVIIALFAYMARQERVRLSERVQAGLQRARAKGVVLGRRRVRVDREAIQALRGEGRSWAEVTEITGLSKGTAQRAAA